MVRLDKCVEALYDNGVTIEDRSKSLNILKVMKGAISMSKSKTGECIFRNNKAEKTNLDLTIKRHRKDSIYNVARINTNKKMVVGRWTKILEKQTVVNAQTLFEEALDIRSPRGSEVPEANEDSHLKSYVGMRLSIMENAIGGNKLSFRRRRRKEGENSEENKTDEAETKPVEAFVSERKEIRDKYGGDVSKSTDAPLSKKDIQMQASVLSKSTPIKLPSMPYASGTRRHDELEKKEADPEIITEERDSTNWKEWRLKDKGWILGYIRKERTRHEDLIIRNALNKIENEMSGANTIKRHQIRQKLQIEREAEQREFRKKEQMSRSPTLIRHGSRNSKTPDSSKSEPVLRSVTFMEPPVKKGKRKVLKKAAERQDDHVTIMSETRPKLPEAKKQASYVGQLPVILEHPLTGKEKSLPSVFKMK